MANMAKKLFSSGADGLVLFNRFLQPDIDLETLTVEPRLVLSSSDELLAPLAVDRHPPVVLRPVAGGHQRRPYARMT